MRRHIERIKAKPVHVRKRIALYASVGVTALIFIFWLGVKLGPVENSANTVAKLEHPGASQPPASPIKTTQASLSEAFNQFLGGVESGNAPSNTPLEVKPMR